MTDDYTPLTDEQVGAIRDDLQWRVPDVLRRILADREHYKRRAETAENLVRRYRRALGGVAALASSSDIEQQAIWDTAREALKGD